MKTCREAERGAKSRKKEIFEWKNVYLTRIRADEELRFPIIKVESQDEIALKDSNVDGSRLLSASHRDLLRFPEKVKKCISHLLISSRDGRERFAWAIN
jgi:hypothetical protein